MDLETLHKRVVKLEKLVGQLSKWTHFNKVSHSDDEHDNEEADTDGDMDDFTFEILPDPGPGSGSGVDDDPNDPVTESNLSCSGTGSGSGDDSDYSPYSYSKMSKKPKRRKMSKSSKSGTGVSRSSCSRSGSGIPPGHITWTLPTSYSVQRAAAISSSSSATANTSSSCSNPLPDTGTDNQNQDQIENPNNSVILKTEVDFPDEFNENLDRDLEGLYPDQGDLDDDENGRIQLIPSSKGNPMIEKDGYLFTCDKHSTHKRIFKCDQAGPRRSSCLVRLHTDNNLENPRLLHFTGEHNHPPKNPHAAEVRKVVAVIRQEALNQRSTPAAEIIEQCLQQLPPELKDHLPRMDSLKRIIRSARGVISENKKPRQKFPRFRANPTQTGPDHGESSNSTNSNSNSATTTTTPTAQKANTDDRLVGQAQTMSTDNHPQVVESNRGRPMLEKGGYLFHLNKFSGTNKRIWSCNRYGTRQDNCPARLHTTYNLENLEELGQLGEHTHPPNPMTLEVRRVMAAIRHEALTTNLTQAQILANHFSQLPPEAKEMLRLDNVKRQIRKIREPLKSTSTSSSTGTSHSQSETQSTSQTQSSSNPNLPHEFNLLQPFPPPHPQPHPQEPSLLQISSFGGHHHHHLPSLSGPGWNPSLP